MENGPRTRHSSSKKKNGRIWAAASWPPDCARRTWCSSVLSLFSFCEQVSADIVGGVNWLHADKDTRVEPTRLHYTSRLATRQDAQTHQNTGQTRLGRTDGRLIVVVKTLACIRAVGRDGMG